MSVNTPNSAVRRFCSLGILTGYLILGSGCSWVPDYANPVEWYNGTRDWIAGEDEAPPAQPPSKISQAEEPTDFPRINAVPERPSPPSEAEKKKMASGLAADWSSARYTDQQVRAGKDITPPRRAASSRAVSPTVMNAPQNPVPQPVTRTPLAAPRAPETRSSMASNPPAPPQIAAVPAARPVRPAPAMTATTPMQRPAAMAGGLPPNMVAADAGGSVFVQADRFSPRFPAGTAGRISAGQPAIQSNAAPVAGELPVAIVYFGNNSSRLNGQAKSRIRRVVALYRQGGRGAIQVVGHASSRTPNLNPSRHHLANFRVSNNRANAVAQELIRLGVDPNAVTVSAVADQQPAFVEVMPAGEAGNRRAEIFFAR